MPDTSPTEPDPRSAPQVPAYILAGGRSVRFGSDKARALVEGEPLIRRVADGLAQVTGSITAVAQQADAYADLGVKHVAIATKLFNPKYLFSTSGVTPLRERAGKRLA